MTINEKINQMTEQEKAVFFGGWTKTGACNDFGIETNRKCDGSCDKCILEWLLSSADVVQCKDCEHWHHSGYCKKLGIQHDRFANDFCSYGVKK